MTANVTKKRNTERRFVILAAYFTVFGKGNTNDRKIRKNVMKEWVFPVGLPDSGDGIHVSLMCESPSYSHFFGLLLNKVIQKNITSRLEKSQQ
jgi:hypothetical protein